MTSKLYKLHTSTLGDTVRFLQHMKEEVGKWMKRTMVRAISKSKKVSLHKIKDVYNRDGSKDEKMGSWSSWTQPLGGAIRRISDGWGR